MNTALDASQRTQLERLVGQCRAILEADLEKQAAGRYGIDADGTIAPEDTLRLDPSALAARREIVAVVAHLQSEGAASGAAVARLLREAVFTHLNRLIAIRIAEAIGLLPPSLSEGRRSQGFRDLLELAPLLAADDTGGYWVYLQLCGDELVGDVPALFDPRNPLLALVPSPGAVDQLTGLLADPATTTLWNAPDCLGWVYQFFNTRDEREAMRDESAAPRDSRELAVRNQFFTPRYVVDFLVQNSLGRRLMESDPESPLIDDLPLLVDPPVQQGEAISLDDVSVLDPACGSGHFLLAAYDVLERAWHYVGVPADEAAANIVGSLWGIDIDPRCTQVAAAAVIFRARRSSPRGTLPRPNIICARSLPRAATGFSDVLDTLPMGQRQLVERLTDALADTPILGPLLKIEGRLAAEVKAAAIGGPALPGTLADVLSDESLQALENELLNNLSKVASNITASPAERLFAAEADDAVRFVQALQRRYDSVLMNPPFGEPVPETKPYLRAAYPWIPTRDYNLLGAFVGRGLELCKPTGRLGAITSRAGLFQVTFEHWRDDVLLSHRLIVLIDLGYGVMEQAMVEAAAYVIGAEHAKRSDSAMFVRLLRDSDRPKALESAVASARSGGNDGRLYEVPLTDFTAIPSKPLSYWMSPSIRHLFSDLPALEGSGAEARQGLASGDDFRFVRAFWEVDSRQIAVSRDETFRKRWAPFAKGGEYSPYWSDIRLLIDWERDGERVRSYGGSRPQNIQYFFRPGLTWPDRATALAPRVLPSGCVFSHVGMGLFPLSDPLVCLAWTNSRLARALADLMVSGREESRGVGSPHYYVGVVQRVPWPGGELNEATRTRLSTLCERMIDLRRTADRWDETSRSFVAPAMVSAVATSLTRMVQQISEHHQSTVLAALDVASEIDTCLLTALKISGDSMEFLDEEMPPSAAVHPRIELNSIQREDVLRLAQVSMPDLVHEAVDRCGGSRSVVAKSFVADRRIELISQILRRHPSIIMTSLTDAGWLPPGEPAGYAEAIISYLVGCALGRWDVRIGKEPDTAPLQSDPFDVVSVCSPGSLVAEEGVPVSTAPAGYPFELPPSRILLDEPGRQWDIEKCVVAAGEALFEQAESILADLGKTLGVSSIRSYLRRRFFRAHVSAYSQSRRKAPIYWPLYVPSGAWGIWVYAPALSRETLFAITGAAASRLEAAETEIRRLQRERTAGGAGRSARDVAIALESEEHLASELRRFRDEAERIAALGWEPDLDDGLILCAAPLADLFPAWSDAAVARQEIKAGAYPWATVSRWADRL